MRTFLKLLLVAVLGVTMAACGSLGLQAPQSTQDRLQYAKAVLTGVNNTLADNVGVSIPATDARGYLDDTRKAHADLKLAEDMLTGLKPGGDGGAQAIISATLIVLQRISAELKSRYPTAKMAPMPKAAAWRQPAFA